MRFVRRGMGRRTYAASLPQSVFFAWALVACGGDSTNTLLSGGAAGWGGGDPGTGQMGASNSGQPPAVAPGVPAPSDAGGASGSSGSATSSTGSGASGGSTGSGGSSGGSTSGSSGGGGSTSSGSSGGSAPPTFTLIDTSVVGDVNGTPVSAFDPLVGGAMIDVSVVGSQLSVRANTTPPVVGSVAFTLDVTRNHVEEIPPYMLCSDNTMGRINDCHLSLGHHVISATAFAQPQQYGAAGPTGSVDFTLFDSSADAGGW